jgi:hypothetical protein
MDTGMLDTRTPGRLLHGPTRAPIGRTRTSKHSTRYSLLTRTSKRVFLLGPSHHYYLTGAATTQCDKYGTPFGDLIVDTALVRDIQQQWGLESMSRSVDEEEHSLEMHLPYIYKMLSLYVFLLVPLPLKLTLTQEKCLLPIEPLLCAPPSYHDRQHRTVHRDLTRLPPRPLPLRPVQHLRHQLRLLPLGLALPLHILPGRRRLVSLAPALELANPTRLADPREHQGGRPGEHGRSGER